MDKAKKFFIAMNVIILLGLSVLCYFFAHGEPAFLYDLVANKILRFYDPSYASIGKEAIWVVGLFIAYSIFLMMKGAPSRTQKEITKFYISNPFFRSFVILFASIIIGFTVVVVFDLIIIKIVLAFLKDTGHLSPLLEKISWPAFEDMPEDATTKWIINYLQFMYLSGLSLTWLVASFVFKSKQKTLKTLSTEN